MRGSMWDIAAIILVAVGIFFWIDSLRARERAVEAGRSACKRYALQFLDDTVSFSRLRLGRDDEGQLKLARTYTFEFSDTGNNQAVTSRKQLSGTCVAHQSEGAGIKTVVVDFCRARVRIRLTGNLAQNPITSASSGQHDCWTQLRLSEVGKRESNQDY